MTATPMHRQCNEGASGLPRGAIDLKHRWAITFGIVDDVKRAGVEIGVLSGAALIAAHAFEGAAGISMGIGSSGKPVQHELRLGVVNHGWQLRLRAWRGVSVRSTIPSQRRDKCHRHGKIPWLRARPGGRTSWRTVRFIPTFCAGKPVGSPATLHIHSRAADQSG